MVVQQLQILEREKGIEPSSQAWEARVLPLNHSRSSAKLAKNSIRVKRVTSK